MGGLHENTRYHSRSGVEGDITNRKDKHGNATDDCRCVRATTRERNHCKCGKWKERNLRVMDSHPCLHIDIEEIVRMRMEYLNNGQHERHPDDQDNFN